MNQHDEIEIALIDLYLQVVLVEMEYLTEPCEDVEDQAGIPVITLENSH